MKQLIFDAARHLMTLNGQTTTLEVKNYLHTENANDPNFELYQKQVSDFMRELAGENGWHKSPSTAGYVIYSDPTLVQQPAPLALGFTAPAKLTTGGKAGGAVVPNTSLPTNTGPVVGYVRDNPKLHVTGLTRAEARTQAYKLFRAYAKSYKGINTCGSQYYFFKKVI